MKAITAALLAALALSACNATPPLSQEAYAAQCQQEGGKMMWKGSIKRCVYNDLFEQHPTNAIVLAERYNSGVGVGLRK